MQHILITLAKTSITITSSNLILHSFEGALQGSIVCDLLFTLNHIVHC